MGFWDTLGSAILGLPVASKVTGGAIKPTISQNADAFGADIVAIGEFVGGTALVLVSPGLFVSQSSVGSFIGLGAIAGAGFLIYDGYLRWTTENHSIWDTVDQLRGYGEVGAGAYLLYKGGSSLYAATDAVSGTWRTFDVVLGAVGVLGGGYLIYDGYKHWGVTPSTDSGPDVPADGYSTYSTESTVKNYATGGTTSFTRVNYRFTQGGVDTALSDKEEKKRCLSDGNVWLNPPQGKGGYLRGCYAGKDKDIVKEYNRQVKAYSNLKSQDLDDVTRDNLFNISEDQRTCQQWVDMFGFNGDDGPKMSFVLPKDCREAIAGGKSLDFVPKNMF